MITVLKVILWDKEIGRLVWDARRKLSYFIYNPNYEKTALDISPLAAPISIYREMPVWGEEDKIYQRLPAFIADSLPDSWGNQLFDLWRQQHHLSNSDINPLDKLSFIGKRGMGALEFEPEASRELSPKKVDMASLADLAERIFSQRENARIMPGESITMQSLLTVGTSAGGRQPKAILAINKESGEIRSGQISGLEDYEYYLLKFGNPEYCTAELEMTYYELAQKAGIRMMPSRLYTVNGRKHFMTMRFDRERGQKLFTQTLAALCPSADSYELLITVCRKLHLPESDCQEVFRRMVFNILANNTDDHNKNFSFIMDEEGKWTLAPAYDLTYVVGLGGYLPNEDHCLFMRAKLSNFSREDALSFARDNGIRNPEAIISEVAVALGEFRVIAEKNEVTPQWIGRVESTIINHLKEWDEYETPTKSISTTVNGHLVSNITIEQAYKGNYHLMANIDGKEHKFVIAKNKTEFKEIERIGVANVAASQLIAMVRKYFSPFL